MDLLLTIFLWVAGIFAFYVLGLTIVFTAISETSSPSSKRVRNIIVSIASLLVFVLLVKGVISLFSLASSLDNEFLLWIFYALFFGSFFIWLFTPSKKDDATKDAIKEKMLTNLMMDKLKNSSKD